MALALVVRAGAASRVFVELYGVSGTEDPGVGELSTALDMRMGKMTPKAASDYCKEVATYFDWALALQKEPASIGVIALCSYLRNSLTRGKSIPVKIRCALKWFQERSGMELNAAGTDVRDFALSL